MAKSNHDDVVDFSIRTDSPGAGAVTQEYRDKSGFGTARIGSMARQIQQPDKHRRFELTVYTDEGAAPIQRFESEHPILWTAARDRLIAANVIEPYRPGLATGDSGSWLLSVDTHWTNRPGWKALPLPEVDPARSGVTIRCYGSNGLPPCGWVGDSGAATITSMGEPRCPQCAGGTVPPLYGGE